MELEPILHRGTFQIYQNHAGSYTWWLLDAEQGVIADAPRHYESMADCLKAIEQVKRLAGTAGVDHLRADSVR